MPHLSEYIVAERAAENNRENTNSSVPQSYDVIAPVPENVSSAHAVFTHLFVLGFNALHRGQYRFGENVVIIGLGIVGLGAVCMARAAGARVAAIGNSSSRLEIARNMGQTKSGSLATMIVEGLHSSAEAGIDRDLVH
jgi:threonine dehydrogenase-like Zn-dependent dehydrogenase